MTRSMIWAALALSTCSAAPAFAQTISGCGTATIAKADQSNTVKLQAGAECFAKAKTVATTAEAARRTRLAALTPARTPAPVPTPSPAPAPAPTSPANGVRPTVIGVNPGGSVYYSTERLYSNLAQGSSPWLDPDAGWGAMAEAKLNAFGYPAAGNGALPINVPQPVWSNIATKITCTWEGAGTLRVDGDRVGETYGNKTLSVTWRAFDRKTSTSRPSMIVYVSGANASDPLRNLDCREAGVVSVGQFDKRYVDDLKPFKLLRFLDWSNANGNPASVTWATRATKHRGGPDGTAIETMVELANATGADAWFTIPWNADADYIQRHAQLVAATLKGTAYYELSNEVWNFQFGVAGQSLNEGIALNLSTDKYTNNLYMLSLKSTDMMKAITPIFAPGKLVRVISAQNDNPWAGERVLEFRDAAKWHDAFATAPYFGHGFFDAPNDKLTVPDAATLDASFARLEVQRAFTIQKARENKKLAAKYGVRYITYEAGQHIIASDGKNAPVAMAMQRDPRMGQAYDRFIADWKRDIGDNLTMYAWTGTISQYGSWGMREYAGQPIAEAPKYRAVAEAITLP